jgi:hypothetical protein
MNMDSKRTHKEPADVMAGRIGADHALPRPYQTASGDEKIGEVARHSVQGWPVGKGPARTGVTWG